VSDWLAEVCDWLAEACDWLAKVSDWLAEVCDWVAEVCDWLAKVSDWLAEVCNWLAEVSDWLAEVCDWLAEGVFTELWGVFTELCLPYIFLLKLESLKKKTFQVESLSALGRKIFQRNRKPSRFSFNLEGCSKRGLGIEKAFQDRCLIACAEIPIRLFKNAVDNISDSFEVFAAEVGAGGQTEPFIKEFL
jgi:hypothetical protein